MSQLEYRLSTYIVYVSTTQVYFAEQLNFFFLFGVSAPLKIDISPSYLSLSRTHSHAHSLPLLLQFTSHLSTFVFLYHLAVFSPQKQAFTTQNYEEEVSSFYVPLYDSVYVLIVHILQSAECHATKYAYNPHTSTSIAGAYTVVLISPFVKVLLTAGESIQAAIYLPNTCVY